MAGKPRLTLLLVIFLGALTPAPPARADSDTPTLLFGAFAAPRGTEDQRRAVLTLEYPP